MNGNTLRYDNRAMPTLVYYDLRASGAGLAEARAIARGFDARTSVLTLDDLRRALAAQTFDRDISGLSFCAG